MNKSEIVDAIAETYGLQPDEVRIIVTKFLDLVLKELQDGGPVKLMNFGRFDVKTTERDWRNPRSGERIGVVVSRKRIAFTPSVGVRHRLNGDVDAQTEVEAEAAGEEVYEDSRESEAQDIQF